MLKNQGYAHKIVLGILIVSMVIQLPLAARRGKTVEVHLRDGGVVRGELLVVKTDSLVVYHRASYEGRTIQVEDIAMVHVIRKSGLIQGFMLGGAAGFLLGSVFPNQSESILPPVLVVLPLGMLTGAIIGAVAGKDKKYDMYMISPKLVRLNLAKLRRFARER